MNAATRAAGHAIPLAAAVGELASELTTQAGWLLEGLRGSFERAGAVPAATQPTAAATAAAATAAAVPDANDELRLTVRTLTQMVLALKAEVEDQRHALNTLRASIPAPTLLTDFIREVRALPPAN